MVRGPVRKQSMDPVHSGGPRTGGQSFRVTRSIGSIMSISSFSSMGSAGFMGSIGSIRSMGFNGSIRYIGFIETYPIWGHAYT